MVAQHDGISMIRCFCSEAASGHASSEGKRFNPITQTGADLCTNLWTNSGFWKLARPVSATRARL